MEVYLDKESVTFDGPPPGSIAEILGLLAGHLEGNGRALQAVKVDGVDYSEKLDQLPAQWTKLECFSQEQPSGPINVLPANKKILAERFPELLSLVEGFQKARVLSAAATEESLYGKEPETQLQDWLEGFEPKDGTLWAVSGFGYGLHIQKLLAAMGEAENLVVVEPDLATLALALAEKDVSALLDDERLHLCLIAQGFNPFAFFDDVHFHTIRELGFFLYPPAHARMESAFNGFFPRLKEAFALAKINYDTNVKDAEKNQSNLFENLPVLLPAPDLSVLKDKFAGRPMLLVGAGPSLDGAEDFLREAARHALVLCGNSSVEKLLGLGIRPDLVVIVDPGGCTLSALKDLNVSDLHLACTWYAFPKTVELFEGRLFSWSSQHQTVNTLRSRLGLPPATPLLEKGTVSASILEMGTFLGCDRICLVGQDMALTQEGLTHTEDSFYKDLEEYRQVDTADLPRIAANNGEKVPTTDAYLAYLRIIEERVAAHPTVVFRNVAATGAKVAGAPYATHAEALEWLGTEPKGDPQAVFAEALQAVKLPEDALDKALMPTYRFAQEVLAETFAAAFYHQELPEKMAAASYANNSRLRPTRKQADRVNALLDAHPRDYQILFEGKAKAELVAFTANRKKLRAQADTPHWATVQENRAYFTALSEGACSLVRAIEVCRENATRLAAAKPVAE